MGNHDALPQYDYDNGLYLITQDEFNWWSDLAERYQKADDRFFDLLSEASEAEKEILYKVQYDDCAGDLENYPEQLQSVCDWFEETYRA